MKTISFIFEKPLQHIPQLEWCIKEYIQPCVHQVILIYVFPERWYSINNPDAMLSCAKLCNTEYDVEKKIIGLFLAEVESYLYKEFNNNLNVTKLVLCGNEKHKLRTTLKLLNVELVILGPDTEMNRLKGILFGDLDTFILKEMGIPVLRIPNSKKTI
ncbi:hypothetical protein TCON_0211 [Astathelohania contejeani]|uniref:UspA domain-containing protein n=1 Tax=Astathelohania contejeani TaxID=164912 RepID=A0ABQ7I2G9_9MICR|nr:hypothetical protein TCON_0211 [Thelohania contejeani]